MGQKDIATLNKIYITCNRICKLFELPFQFKEDTGSFETAIGISQTGFTERPLQDARWSDYKGQMSLFCPDILDFINKIIIEYEETPGKPRHGAKHAKKGHDPDGMDKRTANRDLYYNLANFRVLKIFDYEMDDEPKWIMKVVDFLIICSAKQVEICS